MRHAAVTALGAVRAEITHVNCTRWRRDAAGSVACTAALDTSITALADAVRDFTEHGRFTLLAPDATDTPHRELAAAANLLGAADAVLGFAHAVQEVSAKRRNARLWAPTQVRGLLKLLRARGDKADGAFGEDTSAPVLDMAHEDDSYRKLICAVSYTILIPNRSGQGETRTAVRRQTLFSG
jgi:hypothetical protein